MKGLFDVLKQYLDKIVHEVQEIASSGTSPGAQEVTERPLGSGNATEQAVPGSAGDVAEAVPEKPADVGEVVPAKKEPQESEQRWESLDDILKKLRGELGW